jgi:hypothetical protein
LDVAFGVRRASICQKQKRLLAILVRRRRESCRVTERRISERLPPRLSFSTNEVLTNEISLMSTLMPPRQFPTDPATDASDASEERMRAALGLGRRSEAGGHPPQQTHGGNTHGSDPNRQRRRFAQDGDVPVVVLGRSRDGEAAQDSRITALETSLQSERVARLKAERELETCQTTIQSLRTKLAHAEMAMDEARAAERQARYDVETITEKARLDIESLTAAAQKQAEAEPTDAAPRAARPGRKPKVATAAVEASLDLDAPDEPAEIKTEADAEEPQPIEWWLPSFRVKARGRGRPRKS